MLDVLRAHQSDGNAIKAARSYSAVQLADALAFSAKKSPHQISKAPPVDLERGLAR